MEITSIPSFIKYYKKVRAVTNAVIEVIPHDQLEFSYKEGKFTVADIIRHIAAIERNVFAELIQGNKPSYHGCGKELADGYHDIIRYFNNAHTETLEILGRLSNSDCPKTVKSVNGTTVTVSSLLKALPVHEIHHRASLCLYLNMIGVHTPPILGLTAEQVIEFSNNA